MKIEMNARDLEIKRVITKDGQENEVVQIKPVIGFDPDFVQEMRSLGVRDKAIKEEE